MDFLSMCITEQSAIAVAEHMRRGCPVTDCLQKGDDVGEFSIAGEDGKVWGLRSSTVKLEDHLGHKVTVAGTASGESKAEAKKEKKEGEVENASQKEEYRDLSVTSLKMIGDTCAK